MKKMLKAKNKEGEQLIHLIELYGSLRLQEEYLLDRIRKLEHRVEKLESKNNQKIEFKPPSHQV